MTNYYNCPPYFINGIHRITINVIGAGGNGSLIVTKLARLNKALNHLEHPGFFVRLIDHDIIEKDNVGRQLFTDNDIGRYKSECVMSKINLAFNLDWDCETRKFNTNDANSNILIGCVDNIDARQSILNSFYDKGTYNNYNDLYDRHLFIDCGNARNSGQVILSDFNKTLKNINDLVPNWTEQDTVELQGEGCSYADKLKEQDLFVNDFVSLYACEMIKDLIIDKRINYQGVFFDSKELFNQKIKIDAKRK